MNNEFSIALALGGGGARGIAHIHVLKALDDLGIRPSRIAGSSIGSIVGAGYASGMSGVEIEEFFLSTFSNKSVVFSKLWKLRPASFRKIISNEGTAFGQFNIEKVLKVFLPSTIPFQFDDLSIPLQITATDYYGNKLQVLVSGDLRKAIAASAAIPVIFKPVIIDDTVLIDGGIANPLPFDLLGMQNEKVIAIDVVGLPEGKAGTLPSRIDSGFGASQLMMQSITNLKLATAPPDIFLRPNVDAFKVLDFLKVKEIIAATSQTYEDTKKAIEKLLAR